MGGGLMQLVAYGAQDIYLTGNPQITFFKIVYRRHSNFAIESIEQTLNGTADFNRRVSCTISRNGDLIHRVYLQTSLPAIDLGNSGSFRWVDNVGHFLMKNYEVEIGGQRIDKHYNHWLEIWYQLTIGAGQDEGYKKMIGQSPYTLRVLESTHPQTRLYIPFQAWFCRNVGLALPLIALQYHEVKINIEFEALNRLLIVAPPVNTPNDPAPTVTASLPDASIFVDYIFLDTEERRRFAQVSHEYLIEQLQFTGEESFSSTSLKSRLNFNHPVKELIWTVQLQSIEDLHEWNNYTNECCGVLQQDNVPNYTGTPPVYDPASIPAVPRDFTYGGFLSANPVQRAKIQLNGHDRFQERDGSYFNLVQPYQHHTNIPKSPGINVYSFGLRPEEHQPSGTVNMSRIDNATLWLNCDDAVTEQGGAKLRVFATNYNVLRIMSGIKCY
jgi:Large eukaryotic DNA virus major capsid protein/Major capsid protein N-terminus